MMDAAMGHVIVLVPRARATSARAHGRDALPGLLALALLAAEIAVGRDRAALAAYDRFSLPAGCAFNAPFLDRHTPVRV